MQLQKRTFLPYLRAVPSEALRLGSLYLNPLEPNDGLASRRFEFRKDIRSQTDYEAQIRPWTWDEEMDEPFSIEFETSQAESLGLTLSDVLSLNGERNKATLVTIQGASGRRVKIRDPESFLEEVMKQEGVERWIRRQASIAHKGLFGRDRWKAPELWMVTGVQYVTQGQIHFEGSASKQFSGKVGGDIGAATGAAPPGVLKIRGEAGFSGSDGAKNDFGHENERIWAAQFMPVMIKFGREEDAKLTLQAGTSLPKTIRQFQLQDVRDLITRGIRAGPGNNESPTGPVPQLIGRVVAQSTSPTDLNLDGANSKGIIIDDRTYVTSIQGVDWDKRDAYERKVLELEQKESMRNQGSQS